MMSLILLLVIWPMQDDDIITLRRLSHRHDDRLLHRRVPGVTLDESPIDPPLFRQTRHQPADEVAPMY